ncbi:MAG TPA: hypothetical protein VNO79_05945 [Actinomycetota bacterium]|nr:hypothetical protein [Actinomycetota bacterium]
MPRSRDEIVRSLDSSIERVRALCEEIRHEIPNPRSIAQRRHLEWALEFGIGALALLKALRGDDQEHASRSTVSDQLAAALTDLAERGGATRGVS